MSIKAAEIKKLQKMAEMLKALSHPTRMAIVDLLDREGALNVSAIHSKLKIEQAVISQHLSLMKQKGVLEKTKEGKNCIYYFAQPVLREMIHVIKKCQTC